MKTTEVISIDGQQAASLPDEFRFTDTTVSIRKEGEAVIIEPVKGRTWPAGFFEASCGGPGQGSDVAVGVAAGRCLV